MIVACAGMNRSGSTWQYNIVRAMLARSHADREVRTNWISDYRPGSSCDIDVVKVHRPDDLGSISPDVILSSYRDLRAVAGSMVRMNWAKDEPASLQPTLDRYVGDLSTWEQRADLIMRYDDILAHPRRAVLDIARVLAIGLSDEDVSAILATVDGLVPASARPVGDITSFDPVTLLHDGHRGAVTDEAAIRELSTRVVEWIEDRYCSWLVDRGFELDIPALCWRAQNSVEMAGAALKAAAVPLLTPGSQVQCSAGSAPQGLFPYGFDLEDWGAWSVADVCALRFATTASPECEEIVVIAGALTPSGSPPIVATAYLDGKASDTFYWRDSLDPKELRIPLSSDCGVRNLIFRVEGARTARSLGIGEDERPLGLAIHSVALASR